MTFEESAGNPVVARVRHPSAIGRFLLAIGPRRRALTILALVALALAPIVFIAVRTADARRDIVYWDEFDTALAFILRLDGGTTPAGFLQELFAINNEHRMVTSRLIFAASYWLSGTINFAAIDWVGNTTIIGMCLLLVAGAGSPMRGLRLGLLLAFLMFQLEHYENFLWSGASIDHFQVMLLAAAALVALNHHSRSATLAGILLAFLATFTLAHGLAVWPAGAVLLVAARRHRALRFWVLAGALAVCSFFVGFTTNPAESFVSFSLGGLRQVLGYWLAILGAVPALGFSGPAPFLGAALLAILAYAGARGAVRRERLALPLAAFVLIAAGLIAVGRAEHSAGQVFSRYYVLSALAWALGIFMLLNRHSHPRRPLAVLAGLLPPLVAFNLLANHQFTDETDSWLNCRDIAAVNYKQYGTDGRGPFKLHPAPDHSSALLRDAEARGVYKLGPVCLPIRFPVDAKESNGIKYYVEEVATNADAVAVRGWAAIGGRTPPRGNVRLVLRSGGTTHVFTTVTVPRGDVPVVMKQPGWTNAGFHFARRLAQMPAGDFQIGLLVNDGDVPYFIMTDHRLTVQGARAGTAFAGIE